MNKLEGVETTIQKNVQTRWSNDDTGRYFGSMMTLRHRAKITKEENVTIREDGGKMLICGNVEKKKSRKMYAKRSALRRIRARGHPPPPVSAQSRMTIITVSVRR